MGSQRKNDVFVVQHPDGWAVKKPGLARASAVVSTQKEAIKRAKKMAGQRGTLRVQGKDSKFK